MSLPTQEIEKYFKQTGERSTNISIIWRCNECRDEMRTGECVKHLLSNHAPIFEDLEARRIIIAVKARSTEGRNNSKDERKAVRPCEMCETFYDNDRLSTHKRFGELI
jgi:hypothetical protein